MARHSQSVNCFTNKTQQVQLVITKNKPVCSRISPGMNKLKGSLGSLRFVWMELSVIRRARKLRW